MGGSRLTKAGIVFGTPHYMSPEQAGGKTVDHRADVYALGIILYEMLTGRVPFEGDNWLAAMAGHLQATPKPISSIRRDVPPAVEAVVLKAMRRYPENRYQSADELLADLDRLDQLDAASFDLSPEAPMGGMAAVASPLRLWALVGMISLGFIVLVTVIIVLAKVLQ